MRPPNALSLQDHMEARLISASEELESLAVKYANEAIELERKGSKRIAGTKYQRAIEVLLKLCSLYPNAPQNKVYLEHAEAYRKRVQELQSDSEPIAHPSDSTEARDRGISCLPGAASRSLPSRMAARNPILWSARMWQDPTGRGGGE